MVRTRFAPSPTGHLHIGGARTALFCWLYAKKMQGTFILRIEDTDLERSTPASVQAILDGMRWLQLNYDEGPFFQTQRFDRYQEVIEQLLQVGKAYRCYCSKERLEKLRETQMANKEKPRYDGYCRDNEVKIDAPFVVRFKNPDSGVVQFHDLIRGELVFNNTELDDLIIARSDGSPTYNFTVVVDDWDMKITHVLRGDDHINNTPRQINILQALGATLPAYAHLPMILGPDGKRLSKREGAASVMDYRAMGILPEALINYLVRLGWSHGDQEIFSIEEMISHFDIKAVNKAPAALNPDKLLWLNQHYMKTSNPTGVARELQFQMQALNIDLHNGPALTELIKVYAERVKTLKEMAERSRFFYEEPVVTAELKTQIADSELATLQLLRDQFQVTPIWTKEAIHAVISEAAVEAGLKLGKLAQPLRIMVTGGTVSPPIDDTLLLLGRERVVERMGQYLKVYE